MKRLFIELSDRVKRLGRTLAGGAPAAPVPACPTCDGEGCRHCFGAGTKKNYDFYCKEFGDPYKQPTLPLPPVAQDLTASEVEDWKLVLASPVGQKVLDKVRATHYRMMAVVTGQRDVGAAAHRAEGFADCYRYLISLGHIQVPPEKKPGLSYEPDDGVWEDRVSP